MFWKDLFIPAIGVLSMKMWMYGFHVGHGTFIETLMAAPIPCSHHHDLS